MSKREKRLFRIFGISTLAFMALAATGAWAQDLIGTTWTSKDTSEVIVELGEGGEFYWKNPNGSEIRLTGGVGGSRFKLSDHKEKGGSVSVDPGVIDLLRGLRGGAQPAAPEGVVFKQALVDIAGEILVGRGEFQMVFENFVEIADTVFTFHAAIESNGTDNPITMTIGPQGNQIPIGGTISYVTKWKSSDSITLTNGQTLTIGSFYLVTPAPPTSFYYSLTHTTYFADFTVPQRYQFVNDLAQPPVGPNLRSELDGRVTKIIDGVIP